VVCYDEIAYSRSLPNVTGAISTFIKIDIVEEYVRVHEEGMCKLCVLQFGSHLLDAGWIWQFKTYQQLVSVCWMY